MESAYSELLSNSAINCIMVAAHARTHTHTHKRTHTPQSMITHQGFRVESWALTYRCYSFIHSGHFYSAPSVLYYSQALPTTARILYRSFTPKRTGNCR